MRKIFLILVLLCVALTGFGQIVIDPEGDKPAFKDRLYFGGGWVLFMRTRHKIK